MSTSPAAFTAATSVVWSAEFTALSMMSFVGYISWPPTIGFLEPAIAAVAASASSDSNRTANFLVTIRLL